MCYFLGSSGTRDRTERTGVVRFPRIRNRTGTEFFGSGSFGSGSRFFRFGSWFPVLFAQGYSCPKPSVLDVVNVGSGVDAGGLGRVVRAGVSKTSALVVSGDTSCDDVGVVICS
jgi:hypothetical protein